MKSTCKDHMCSLSGGRTGLQVHLVLQVPLVTFLSTNREIIVGAALLEHNRILISNVIHGKCFSCESNTMETYLDNSWRSLSKSCIFLKEGKPLEQSKKLLEES